MRVTGLVGALLWCLYALTAGGQGYSVDGTFSYEVARSIATDPAREFLAQNRGTLARWGPVVPALGVPLAWIGARLGEWVPRRDTVPVDGRLVRLYDWPALGALAEGALPELRLALDGPRDVSRLHLVSFLSLSTSLEDGAPVAEVLLLGGPSGSATVGRSTLRAGRESAEWAHSLPRSERPRHREARVVGYWPGNPEAHLYAAVLSIARDEVRGADILDRPAQEVVFRYVAPTGRLHLRSVVVESAPATGAPGSPVAHSGVERREALVGPVTWSDAQQAALFSRFGFSFLNGWLMALTAALLIPLAGLLGYGRSAAVVLALGYGVGTLAWPYAKHDFAEPAAGALALGATVLVFAARPKSGFRTFRLAWHRKRVRPSLGHEPQTNTGETAWRTTVGLLATAGVLAALAAGARYTAAWFVPLLAVQVTLLWLWPGPFPSRTVAVRLSRRMGPALQAVAVFLLPPTVAAVGVLLVTGRAPALWSGWRQGLASGWLDFSVWEGLYGLLVSPGKGLFFYAPPLLLSLAALPWFVRRHGGASFVLVAAPLLYLLVYGSKGVWHGGGWGPRYLVAALPLMAAWSLPVLERICAAERRSGTAGLRWGAAGLLVAGVAVQALGVAKHPNRYSVMFRDHILPQLTDYGATLGGGHALAYWRHFGGPEAGRQLAASTATARPRVGDCAILPCADVASSESADLMENRGAAPYRPEEPWPTDPPRGLGYLFAESGALALRVDVEREVALAVSVYACDWDHRGRRQRLVLIDAQGRREYTLGADFSACEYLTWPVSATPGRPLEIRVEALAADTPVLSGLFFDPLQLAVTPSILAPPTTAPSVSASSVSAPVPLFPGPVGGQPKRDDRTGGAWNGRYGADGHVLFAWRRGGVDVGRLPDYVTGYEGGSRVWLDTGEAELADT
ncbi:MAG: hypothetical protein M3442_15745, partial [Chloroflexota bacterium]|nr:hypothetical protein [Chloroflexota bacterium]